LAEVCASLSLIGVDNNSNNNSKNNNSPVNQVLPIIISAIQGNLQQGNVPSLKLLAALANQLPVVFSKFSVPSLFRNSPSRRCLPFHHRRHHHHDNKLLWKPGPKSFSMPRLQLRLPTSPCPALHLLHWTNWWWTPLWQWPSWDLACSPFSHGFLLALPQTNATQTCLQHLLHASVTCSSLLAGNAQVLLAVDFSQELISSAAIHHLLGNSMGLAKPRRNHARQAVAASKQGEAALVAQLG
jgi:hypothetical protein